jgi:fatty acid desaturase
VPLVLQDPTYEPNGAPTLFERVATRFIQDPRDVPLVRVIALCSITVLPTGLVLFVPGAFRWWLAAGHLLLVFYLLGPFILMLHNSSHRRLFKRRWEWMNYYVPWVLGPFFGESPEAYFTHHVGMHHPENNLEDDISSTLAYQRDRFPDFMRYVLRFLFAGFFELTGYFIKKKRRSLLLRTLAGELTFYFGVLLLLCLAWRPTLMVFVVPLIGARFAMMAGNWGQHAFIDEASPENNYRNSITCINSSYNRRCFNDGYHIGHHLKATRHWTELPVEFSGNLDAYVAERAIVFAGIDFFGVWVCLMLRRYDWLANRYVDIAGARPSPEEITALLQSRTGWTRRRGAEAARTTPASA